MEAKSKTRKAYHHGDLPVVLLKKTEELLEERGVDGFSLREVARRADVAAAAPSHHFGNATGLLTAAATNSFRGLTARFEAVSAQDLSPEEQLVEMCQAYIDHHVSHPGGAKIMFRWELLQADDPDFCDASATCFATLASCVRRNVDASKPDSEVQALAKVIWAAMHGLVSLRLVDPEGGPSLVRLAALSVIRGQS